jgi:hypothetical protein
MQPVHGVFAGQVSNFFQQGRWEELETLYRDALKEDEADARSAFRLGNLLAYLGRYREALVCFETAWLHRWPGPIALNNNGVVLSCLGETRASFKALWDASKLPEGCRPAAYNLAILCEKLGNEGNLPAVIVDLGLGVSGTRANEIARAFFEQALGGQGASGAWAETGPLDRPLFLWVDDLRSGFGFEPLHGIVNVEQAYGLFEEGLSLLAEGRWQDGISKLEASADLHPAFENRIKAPRTEALVHIVRSRFVEIRNQWGEGKFDDASQGYDELIQLAPMLPDRAFADEILKAAVHEIAQQIRSHKPEEGWEVLQRLITAARQRVEDNLQTAEAEARDEAPLEEAGGEEEEEEVSGLEKTPEPESTRPEGTQESEERAETGNGARAVPPASPPHSSSKVSTAEYIRKVCRQAWGKQVTYLLGISDFETAIDLLEFSDIEWFARRDLPIWRRRVYTSQAESLRTTGRNLFRRQEWKEAARYWNAGREAAVRAEDDRVVESLDQLISELLEAAPAEVQVELRTLLDRDDRKALHQCVQKLDLRPGDGCLRARRQALIKQLLAQTRDALEAYQWEAARRLADAILTAVPEEPDARDFFQKAEEGLIAHWAEEGKDLVERGQIEEAKALCLEIEKLDPDHAGAREIRREVEVLRRRAEEGPSAYDEAYYAYVKARDARDPERALELALEMKRLDPRDAHTQEALEWVPPAFISALRVQLERDRTPDIANLLKEKLKRLLSFQPQNKSARDFLRKLRQVAKNYDNRRQDSNFEKLNDAEEALLNNDPEKALEDLHAVRDPEFREEAEAKRQEALVVLRGQIEALLADPFEEKQKKAQEKLKIYQRWDPAYIEAKQREWAQKEEERSKAQRLDDEVKDLETILHDHRMSPFRAFRKLDKAVRTLDLEGSQIRIRRRQEIQDLRLRAKRAMNPFQRLGAWFYDRYHSSDLPDAAEKEEKS